jgi:orotidine-5'-phosphate decarboxylase
VNTHLIAALDTPDLSEARNLVRKLEGLVFAYKIGHALVLPHGLGVVDTLQACGAQRVFLDMKFHDIPNSVALGVYEAARRGVWMMTLHASGGLAMMAAAVEAVKDANLEAPPCLVGVTVLTSVDEPTLRSQLGIERTPSEQALRLAKLAMDAELDGVVCSGQDVAMLREALGYDAVLVAPGIRSPEGIAHDQKRTATATDTIAAGANYIVVGRALTDAPDPENALVALGLS